ncbi:MAG: hypothetical protein V2A74_14350 [bacterium]
MISRAKLSVVALTVWAIMFASLSRADEVRLKNGNVLIGIVAQETEDWIAVSTSGGEINLERRMVERIVRDSPGVNALRQAEQHVASRNMRGAAGTYLQALELGADRELLGESLLLHGQAISEQLGGAERWTRNTWTAFLDRLIKERPPGNDLSYLCGDWYADCGNGKSARRLYLSISPDYYVNNPARRKAVTQYLIALLKSLLAGEEYEEAIEVVVELDRFDPERSSSGKALIYIQWASREREEGNYRKALELLDEELLPISPAIAMSRIKQTLEAASNAAASDSKKTSETIGLYKRYGVTLLGEAAVRDDLAALYEALGYEALGRGEVLTARSAFEQSNQLRDEPNPKLSDLCEFEEKRQKLSDEDGIGYYQLGEFAFEKELVQQARDAFEIAARDSRVADNAREQLGFIQTREEFDLLKVAQRSFGAENYAAALDQLELFVRRYPNSSFLSEAQSLSDLCQRRMREKLELRPYAAEVVFQQAERAYFQQDYLACVEALARLLSEYPDAPSAPRARELRDAVLSQLNLSRLEGRTLESNEITSPLLALPLGPGPRSDEKRAFREELEKIMDQLDVK